MPDFLTMGYDEVFWARPLSPLAMAAAFAAVAALCLFLYRRSWGLPFGLRIALALAKLAAFALVVATLFEPTGVVRETRTEPRSFPVLIDVSESMSLKDPRKRPEEIAEAAAALGVMPADAATATADVDRAVMALDADQRQAVADASRLDLAKAILSTSAGPVLRRLGESVAMSYHAFGEFPRLIQDSAGLDAAALASLKASAPATAIVSSLGAVAKASAARPAGILLVSDGNDNFSSRRSGEILQEFGARGIPVYTVPVGLEAPDDVAIRTIVMQEVAFSGDRVPVRVQLFSQGYEKRTARLTVSLDGRQVAQRDVRFEGGLQFEEIDFRVDVSEKGAAQVAVGIEPFADEVSAANNRIERSIRVVNEKINVLYIEGNARWEFRYLSAILKRDPRIAVTFIASAAGPEFARNSPEHIERFPSTREEAFQYDLVILGDVDAAFFSADELTLLEELIRDRGGSLLMLCGPMHSPTSYADTPVATMLPVRFDADAPWEEVAESVCPVLTPEGYGSLVMTLENDPEENDRAWSRVAPLDQLPPLLGPKPGAMVLATLSDGDAQGRRYPLVAWQRYGTGKCMTVATDRLWRLRFKTGDKYHWRVWSQCLQFLTLSRLLGEHKRIRLETDRATYPVGGQVRLYAQVLDDEFEPVTQPGFDVLVGEIDGAAARERVSLRPDRSAPGLYEGYFTPAVAGRYRLEASDEDAEIANSTEFQVAAVNEELADTAARVDELRRIADLTGGACLTARDLGRLESLVDVAPVTTTIRSERPLWDNGLVAGLLVALLGCEWILRRRFDLP